MASPTNPKPAGPPADPAAGATAPLVDSKVANVGSSPDKDGKDGKGVVGDSKAIANTAVKKDEEGKEEEEGENAGDETGTGKSAKKNQLMGLLSKSPGDLFHHRRHLKDDEYPRTWEFSLAVRSMTNVTTADKLNVFFSVTLKNNRNKTRRLKGLLPKFTPIYCLHKGKQHTLDQPLLMYSSKHFKMSYADLEKWDCQVDMWKVQNLSFNTYFGVSKKTLAEIICKESNRNLILERKKTKKQMASKKERNRKWDVAEFECSILFEEFFQFRLHGDHWTLDMANYDLHTKDFDKLAAMKKRLWLQVPPNRTVLPDQPKLGGLAGRPQGYFAHWNKDRMKKSKEPDQASYWQFVGSFVFKGTRSHLTGSYFLITVYKGRPGDVVVNQPRLQATKPHFDVSAKEMGKAMMSFISILDVSKMQGAVKCISGDKILQVADITGSMRCEPLSIGLEPGDTLLPMKYSKLYCHGQPIAAGSVANLNKREQFLVLKIKQCRNLPMSDPEKGSSNPYIRATWDNMRQVGPRKIETLRPIFNFNFYFPVRSCFMKHLKSKKNPSRVKGYWMQEMEMKKELRIEVWDDDIACSEFLGGVSVSVKDILMSKTKDERTMLGDTKSEGDDDAVDPDDTDDPADDNKGKEWFQVPVRTRIFDCKNAGLPLQGSDLGGNTGTSTVHFEAYFYHDIDQIKELADDYGTGTKKEKNFWEIAMENFDAKNEEFQASFAIPFPNAIGAKESHSRLGSGATANLRRFPSVVSEERGAKKPLMSYLTQITVPETLSTPLSKMHWMRCLTWEVGKQQIRTGLIPQDAWKAPSFILQRRRGAAQCHSLVLCSLLLGAKMDAYVCKGTLWAHMPAAEGHAAGQHLVEHVWVMTREENGWITFWETTSGKCYHLPNRYTPKKDNQDENEGPKKKKAKQKKGGNVEHTDEGEEAPVQELLWEGEVPDVTVGQEDIEALPTVGRHPKAKAKVSAKRKDEIDSQEHKKREMLKKKEDSKFAPNREMKSPENLVNYLPYDSIDVIFNMKNLWANHQNHNPALIKYDFDDAESDAYNKETSQWLPLLDSEKIRLMDEYDINIDAAGDANISLSKALEESQVADLRRRVIDELEENLRLYRSHNGLDTNFAKDEYILTDLSTFLEIQEEISKLDIDYLKEYRDFSSPEIENQIKNELLGKVQPHNRQGSPFMLNSGHDVSKQEQKKILQKVDGLCQRFNKREDDFPVKRGKVFRGVTVHFSTSDVDDMRTYLDGVPDYKKKIDQNTDNIFYTIQCYIAAMSGGIQSVWVYLGTQEDMTENEEEEAVKEEGGQA